MLRRIQTIFLFCWTNCPPLSASPDADTPHARPSGVSHRRNVNTPRDAGAQGTGGKTANVFRWRFEEGLPEVGASAGGVSSPRGCSHTVMSRFLCPPNAISSDWIASWPPAPPATWRWIFLPHPSCFPSSGAEVV